MARAVIVGIVLLTLAPVVAQTSKEPNDPVTGKWGADGQTFLELQFDGKSRVTGTTIWRVGDSYAHRAPITAGRFDTQTGALKLEGEATAPDGVTVKYVIEGRIEKDTVAGTFTFGDSGGEFQFKRLEA